MLPQKKRQIEGGRRKATLHSVVDELLVWINEMHAKNQQVAQSSIQQKALISFATMEKRPISLLVEVSKKCFAVDTRSHHVGQQ